MNFAQPVIAAQNTKRKNTVQKSKRNLHVIVIITLKNVFYFLLKLRLGAQSVTLLSTLRDPTQLRQRQCPTRKQHPFFVPLRCLKPKNSNSYCSSKGRKSFLVGKKVQQGFRGFRTCFWAAIKGVLLSSCPLTLS